MLARALLFLISVHFTCALHRQAFCRALTGLNISRERCYHLARDYNRKVRPGKALKAFVDDEYKGDKERVKHRFAKIVEADARLSELRDDTFDALKPLFGPPMRKAMRQKAQLLLKKHQGDFWRAHSDFIKFVRKAGDSKGKLDLVDEALENVMDLYDTEELRRHMTLFMLVNGTSETATTPVKRGRSTTTTTESSLGEIDDEEFEMLRKGATEKRRGKTTTTVASTTTSTTTTTPKPSPTTRSTTTTTTSTTTTTAPVVKKQTENEEKDDDDDDDDDEDDEEKGKKNKGKADAGAAVTAQAEGGSGLSNSAQSNTKEKTKKKKGGDDDDDDEDDDEDEDDKELLFSNDLQFSTAIAPKQSTPPSSAPTFGSDVILATNRFFQPRH